MTERILHTLKYDVALPVYRFGRDIYYISGYYYSILFKDGIITHDNISLDIRKSGLRFRNIASIKRKGVESAERKLVNTYVENNVPVIEIGAGLGMVSVSINRLLNRNVYHYALEPNTRIIPTLKKTRKINKSDFHILNVAYDPHKDKVMFNRSEDYLSSFVDSNTNSKGDHSVESFSLRNIIDRFKLSKFQLVCDIEGSEYNLIDEEIDLISEKCTTAIIEFHSRRKYEIRDYVNKIESAGLDLVEIHRDVYAFKK